MSKLRWWGKQGYTLKQDAHKRSVRRENEERRNWYKSSYQGDLPYDYFDNVEGAIYSTGHPNLRYTLEKKRQNKKYNRAISKGKNQKWL